MQTGVALECKHESTPSQTHRQRTSVSAIAYNEAFCQFGVKKSAQ